MSVEPYWTSKDGRHCLYLGDCRSIIPGLRPVDITLTDPPYNVGMNYGTHNDSMSLQDFTEWVRSWFTSCRRISETVLVTGQGGLPQFAIIEPWKWLLCWWKPASMGRSPVGFCNWEPIALWGKGSSEGCDVLRSGIIPKVELDGHPCPKPLGWALGQLVLFPNAETILDPFTGSGTTGVACIRTGRRFIGIEIHQPYADIAVRRMEQELSQPMLPIMEPEKPDTQEVLF